MRGGAWLQGMREQILTYGESDSGVGRLIVDYGSIIQVQSSGRVSLVTCWRNGTAPTKGHTLI
jgi:hypothetical protein